MRHFEGFGFERVWNHAIGQVGISLAIAEITALNPDKIQMTGYSDPNN